MRAYIGNSLGGEFLHTITLRRVRKLIRSKSTGAFLTSRGTWTDSLAAAWQFSNYDEALAMAERWELEDPEIYFSFESQPSTWDFTIQVPFTTRAKITPPTAPHYGI
jgi:hypothetical protein